MAGFLNFQNLKMGLWDLTSRLDVGCDMRFIQLLDVKINPI